MKKKNIGIYAITMLIVGLMIAVSATATIQISNEEKHYINWNRAEACISGEEVIEITHAKELKRATGQLSADPLYNGAYPDIANGGTNILLGFDDVETPGTWFTFSPDGGASWHEDAYGWDIGESMWPSVDFSAGNRFYGTNSPDWSTSGYITQCDFVDITDPDTWVAGTWNWEDNGFWDFEGLSMAAMDDSLEDWRWGYITLSGFNGYGDYSADGCPFVTYPVDDGTATLSWLIDSGSGEALGGCSNAASEIDPVRYYNYAVWQRYDDMEEINNLEFRKDDAAEEAGESGFVTAGELVTSENNENPDVSAYDSNVIIVSEADGDIVCYYSNNGLSNFDISFVASTADDETYPRITHTGEEDEAICTFIKNGNIYYSMTNDGGATWDEPTKINDIDGQVTEDYLSSGICELGACYGGNDDVVYYGAVGAKAIITIEGFSGGLGATATIKNVGTADATDVECSITVTGGILGMIDKTVTETKSIAVNEEVTISTGIFFGLGAIEIAATADTASDSATGTQLLVYTMIK